MQSSSYHKAYNQTKPLWVAKITSPPWAPILAPVKKEPELDELKLPSIFMGLQDYNVYPIKTGEDGC